MLDADINATRVDRVDVAIKDEEDIDNCSIRSKKLHVQSSEDKSIHRSKHI